MQTLSGDAISKIALGTWGLGGVYTIAGQPAGIPPAPGITPERVLTHALERGVNLVDTSAAYGTAEQVVGRAIAGRREHVFVATKAGLRRDGGRRFSYRFLADALRHSCRLMHLDVVDLYQAALGADDEVASVLNTLNRLKRQGRTRYIGVSVAHAEQGRAALESGMCDAVQVVLNLLDTRCWDLARQARQCGVAVLVKSPLNKGVLTRRVATRYPSDDARREYLTPTVVRQRLDALAAISRESRVAEASPDETAVRFVLSLPFVDAVLFGARCQAHIDRLWALSDAGCYDQDTLERFKQASCRHFPDVAATFGFPR